MDERTAGGDRAGDLTKKPRLFHLKPTWVIELVVATLYAAAVIFAAVTHQPLADNIGGTTVAAKHHDGNDWQLDLITGRHSSTIHVNKHEYDSYRPGDVFHD
ncbi:MAG: hypothetical protein ABI130_11025 [Leifsonia sp.]